ncbi:hypothetical protein BC940DRAFT_362932 [Gongronella butleri]|nr:hypothetical protein BC940DRAFT_362932 [Gongronella butleri]
MANLQGKKVRLQLKNKDAVYGILSSIDDDNSISLENAVRHFATGRQAVFPFLKVPGHIIESYATAAASLASPAAEQPPAPAPAPVAPTPTPTPPVQAPAAASAVEQSDGAKLLALVNHQTSHPSATPAEPEALVASSGPASPDASKPKAKKERKTRRGTRGTKNTTASVDSASDSAQSSPKASKKPAKKQQQQQQQQQQSPQTPPSAPANPTPAPAPVRKPMPQFATRTAQPRKVVASVDYDDYSEFVATPEKLTQKKQPQRQPQTKKAQELHKPDDPVNQSATQSLLSSLNMVGASIETSPSMQSPNAPVAASPLMSSTIASSGSASPMEHHHRALVPDDTTPSPILAPEPAAAPIAQMHRKPSIDTQAIRIPAALIPPKLRARPSGQRASLTGVVSPPPSSADAETHILVPKKAVNGITDDGQANATPTRTMVPILTDADTEQAIAAITADRADTPTTHETTFILEEQPTANVPLQKPMDDDPMDTPNTTIKTVTTGKPCPVLTVQQLEQLIHITSEFLVFYFYFYFGFSHFSWLESDCGLSNEMLIENGAHAAASIAFKMIGGQRRVKPNNHNDAPIVVILAGNHTVGCYSMATARHLANRGIQVLVLLVANDLSSTVEDQKRCAELSGATFIQSVDDLPDPMTAPVDLIIDGLLGSTSKLTDLKHDHNVRTLLWQAIDWSNNNKASILSLDFPSGVNGKDGHPFHVMHYISPKWTLCFGAPVEGCLSSKVTGGLFVADIGIPVIAWRKLGIKGIVWGSDFVMSLEYD